MRDIDPSTAELRWAGAPILVRAHTPRSQPRLARLRGDHVAATWFDRVGTNDVFLSVAAAFGPWPLQVGAGVVHRAGEFRHDFRAPVVRPDGVFAVRTGGTLSVGSAGTTDIADIGSGFAFGWEVDGPGLFVVTSDGEGSWRVAYRSDATPDAVVTDLGGFELNGFGFPVGCSLADGSFLVATLPEVPIPHPLGLYLARRSRPLETLAEPPIYPPSGRPPKRASKREAPEPVPEVMNGKIVAASDATFVAPRPEGGVWVVTCGTDRALVYRVDTSDVGGARPLEIPLDRSQRVLAITPIGSRVAFATRGNGGIYLWITDGETYQRGVGAMARADIESDWPRRGSLVSNEAGTSILFAHGINGGFQLARADLLTAGDPRLAQPAYDEPTPPPPEFRKPWHERKGMRSRDGCVSALRIWGILDAFVPRPAMRFSGDFSAGSAIAQGAGVRAAWGAEGVVILEAGARKRKVAPTVDDLLPHLPDELRQLAAALPVAPSLKIALWVAADGRSEPWDIGALEMFSFERMEAAIHSRVRFHKVQGLGELAKSLEEASRTHPHILTGNEQEKLLANPSGAGRAEEALAQVKAALAELGIVWP